MNISHSDLVAIKDLLAARQISAVIDAIDKLITPELARLADELSNPNRDRSDELHGLIEQKAFGDVRPHSEITAFSSAISLKRIADTLDDSLRTGHADGRSLHDILSSIEMNGRAR